LERAECGIDDFCQTVEPLWFTRLLGNGLKSCKRAKGLFLSEIMTILVSFHQNHYRNFKHFYFDYVCVYWRNAFPGLPSYQRFVEWMPSTLVPLCAYLKQYFGNCTGISFIDATSLKVCGSVLNLWKRVQMAHPNSKRLMNNPMTISCIRIDLEQKC
jgi:hypothetical protein